MGSSPDDWRNDPELRAIDASIEEEGCYAARLPRGDQSHRRRALYDPDLYGDDEREDWGDDEERGETVTEGMPLAQQLSDALPVLVETFKEKTLEELQGMIDFLRRNAAQGGQETYLLLLTALQDAIAAKKGGPGKLVELPRPRHTRDAVRETLKKPEDDAKPVRRLRLL